MREIKFRAWAITSEKMFLPSSDEGWEIIDGKIYNLPNTVLMQYTGEKDKNGKEIYEGDIMYNPADKYTYPIIWDDREAAWSLGGNGTAICKYSIDRFWEVIGNIYENPNLLKGAENELPE